MKNIKRTATRFGFIAAMLFALVAMVMPVTAATITATSNITGVITPTTSGTLAFAATLTGAAQTITPATNSVSLSATDSTSPDSGLNITLLATTFKSTSVTTDVLGAFGFTGGAQTTAAAGTVSAAGQIDTATALKVFSLTAAQDTSTTAAYGLTPTFNLLIPLAAKAHSDYTSTLTVAYAAGP